MEVLKQARGHLKGTITRVHNLVSDSMDQLDLEILEVRLERLEETWKAFCRNQEELFAFHTAEGYGDPEVDFVSTEMKYVTAKSALLKSIRKQLPSSLPTSDNADSEKVVKQQVALFESLLNKSTSSSSVQKSPAEIELPAFKISPFSGDYREWPGFRDMFLGSIDCKKNLPGAQKLRYLKSFLRDDAAKLLNHIEIADNNYEQAWEKLENRYNKPLYIINAYIESFLKLPMVANADSTRLRCLTDNADEVIRGLKALPSESRDPWLIYLLLNKTDSETRKAWSLANKKMEEATIQELIDFLDERCSALEACEPKGRNNKTAPRSGVSHVKSLAVSNSACPQCKGNHLLHKCSQFQSMSILSRRNFVRDERLCYNCLGSNHSSARCRVKARCSICQTRHHTLVHLDQPNAASAPTDNNIDTSNSENSSSMNSLAVVSHHIKNAMHSSGILPTVLVKIIDVTGKSQLCRVLLDTGSQVSLITERLVNRLGLRRRHARVPITGISSQSAGVTHGVVQVNLLSRFDSTQVEVNAYILKEITSQTPLVSFALNNLSLLKNLQMADPGFNESGPIDLLLGADIAWNILRDGRRTDDRGNLVAHNTVFGWVITGNMTNQTIVSLHVGVEDLDAILKTFWEIEEIPLHLSVERNEDFAEAHFSQTFSRAPDCKYIVELPFRQSEVRFGNTLSGALSRLSSMERRFARNENLRKEYCQFMKTYLELGHMQRIPDNLIEPNSGRAFYLPHHAVITNKIRVVFDGSHRDSNGISLNEMLHTGPPLQRNLVNVCIRFRLPKYVFCADIVKMFRQIWVAEKHRDFQRIVWRESSEQPIAHYWLCTVTYGTSPAPFLSMKTLKQLAVDYRYQFPLASRSILSDFYVDDLLTGADSMPEVIKLRDELVELLSCGGFQLSKWSSNCWPILSGIDHNDIVSLDLDSQNSCTKVLGLVWNPYHDIFTFKIAEQESSSKYTKRKLLSEVAKIFDPLGFLSPSTILFKMLFQELWLHKSKVGWDDPLPTEVARKWIYYRQELEHFEKVEILRQCTSNSRSFDLIGFSDASEKAYSAVVYARSVSENGQIEVHLIAAKTRVAPVKQLTIPRLELCGALLLSRLIQLIKTSLDVSPSNTFAFCDSQIVLAWFASPPRRWNTFVANRTSEILDVLPRSVWSYIRSEENPADCASRGIEPSKLLQLELWWKGPGWISKDFSFWPNYVQEDLEEVPEGKKIPTTVNLSRGIEHFLGDLSNKISVWGRLVRTVAYIIRFVKNCRLPAKDRRKTFVSSSELLAAKQTCIRFVQEEFKEEVTALKSAGCVANRSKLSSLAPFLDDVGLLRVGGRITNAVNVPFHIKHPIILPKKHSITVLILRAAHLKFLHAGVTHLFALVRQEFWVLGSRNLIRKIVFECKECFRLRQNTSIQLMGNLPASRLNASYAFDHTGCDYAGPITLRLSKGRRPKLVKGYIALFVCMSTKALHLEVVSDLSTDAFLAALRRFIARRGKCSVLYSDNGTNFQGASRLLSEWFQLVRSSEHNERISSALATDNIKWEFIPPHSPHFGGLWEAGVKCVKQHLHRVVGNNILTFEEMTTLLAQIEALLNSRPLCAISDTDLNPLTPSHLLIGRPYTAIPEPSYLEVPINRLGRWQLLQNMMQGFWQRWHTDYITSLQQRPKWKQQTRDLVVGDLVVLKEPNLPPSKWSLGRIEATHPGSDGHVRVVSVRTNNTTYKRPITRVALLPCS